MVKVPRHPSQRELSKRFPLVTDEATVTERAPMDRSRNDEILAAIREECADLGQRGLLHEVKRGADYDWNALYRRLRGCDAERHRLAAVETLTERFERPYPSLLRLRVEPDTDVDFSPGQYVTLRSHGTPRAYSIASAPGQDELEFAIRRVPGGRLTEELFVDLAVGDEVVVRGPNGDMVLEKPGGRDVVFLATGTGVAPFKSMIDALYEHGWHEQGDRTSHVWLILGCGWADDLPYRQAFRERDHEYDSFHFVPTLTRESLLSDWDGETDYVQRVLVRYLADEALDGVSLPQSLRGVRDAEPASDVEARIHPERSALYACGITAMVSTLVTAARAVGFPPADMQYEGFG